MKKTKKLLFAIVWIAITILSQKTFSQTTLNFDDKYFNAPNWNPIYTSNIAEITFNTPWDVYDWFWLFFLWTWTDLTATLKIDNQSITCSKQLNWYFTTNFTDYAMFPLDQNTQNKIHDTGINYSGWWLFYECKKNYWPKNAITWVYWQIIREYLSGTDKNEYKIQVWIGNNNWADTSSLQLIYSDNFRNDWRTLSGTINTSTSKWSVTPRFFGDVWITNAIKSGTINDPLYIMTWSTFYNDSGHYKIFARSSVSSKITKITLTWFDIDWQPHTSIIVVNTWLNNISLPFYGYKDFYFPNIPNLVSGTIATTISGSSWSKTISFLISWVTNIEIFSLSWMSDICTTWVTITILPNYNTGNRQYKRWDNNPRTTWNNIRTFTSNRSGQVQVQTSWTIISWENLFINITNIDNTPPTITQNNLNTWINQCESRTGDFTMTDNECGSWKLILQTNVNNYSTSWISPLTDTVTFAYDTLKNNDFKIIYTWQDSIWNNTWWEIQLAVIPANIDAQSFKRELKIEDNMYSYSWNRKEITAVTWWSCDNITIKSYSCDYGNIQIDWDILYFTSSIQDNNTIFTCDIILSWDYSTKTITWIFIDCSNGNELCTPRLSPIFTGWAKYSYYENKTWNFKKYTSWGNVIIEINWDCMTDGGCSGYRYSYIPQDKYCTHLTKITENIEALSIFYSRINTQNLSSQICDNSIPARKERKNYPESNTFDIVIEDSHADYNIPYNGKEEWRKVIRIEVSDKKGRISRASTDIINHTTQNPIIESYPTQTFNNNPQCQWINSDCIQITVTANWATIQNWQSWQNSTYKNQLTQFISGWLMHFDQFNEWIILPQQTD